MANRIKGITIEIDGNTTKLQSALKAVNSDINQTQRALKDVDKLLKLDPTNTTLLTQKQDLLKKAIQDTESKLKQEKAALDQLQEGNSTGELTQEQQALEREIIDTEQQLKSLKKEYNDFGSVGSQQMKAVGEKISATGEKMTAVGTTMTQKVTTPIVAGAAGIAAGWKNVDSGMDIVIQKTGATGQSAENLKGIVKSLATEIPTDFETAGTAVGEVNTKFGLTGQALQDLSGQFIKFADLNNTDVNTAIDGTQQALTAWGLSANDAGGFLDRVNLVAQQTGASVDSLISNTATSATAFQEMGLSVDGAVTFLGQLEMSGADSSAAMSGLQKALKNATNDGIPLNQALSNLQNTVKNGNGAVDGLTASYDLFGKSGAQIYQAVQNGTLDFNNLAGAVQNAGGSVSNTFTETKDPADNFKTSLNELSIIGYDIAESAMPMIETAMKTLADVLRDVNTWWNGLDSDTQEFIIKAALLVAAIGPVLTIFGSLVSAIGAIVGALAGLSVAFAPLLIGGLIVAGVVAGAALIISNWDSIKAAAGRVAQGVSQKWNELKTSTKNLKEDLGRQWDNLKSTVGSAAEGLKQRAESAFSTMKTSMSTTMENAKGIVSNAFERIKGFANFVWKLPELGLDLIESVPEKIRGIVDRIKALFDFRISFPHIPLPHFSWHWESIGGVLNLPHFDGIQWYKKAYDTPYLFTSPTVVGNRGFGDGGGSGELVYGRDQLLRDIAMASGGETVINVYASEGMDINQLADKIQQRLALVQRQKVRAYA